MLDDVLLGEERVGDSRTGRKYRMLVLAEKVGATQTISFEQPIGSGSAEIEDLELYSPDESHLAYLSQAEYWRNHKPSVLVLSRYSDARILPVIKLAREHGVPSIFHLDDDLLDVPLALGVEKYEFYQQPEKLRNLREALNLVDLVYASTEPLAQRLIEHGVTTEIFAGKIYCSIAVKNMLKALPATGPVMGYMGTGGHSADLAMVVPAIVRLMHEMPMLRFETFGTITPPPELAAFAGRYTHHAGVSDYRDFLNRLRDLGWWVGICPIEDTPFNRCKADTKWVEYSLAGIAVAASDVPVYHRACAGSAGALCTTFDDWYRQLGAMMRSAPLRRSYVTAAREKLVNHYTHESLRQQLVTVIDRAALAYRQHQSVA